MTFKEAVDRLEKAGARKVVVRFSGVDDSGGINEVEVDPESAKTRLEEAGLWEGVYRALERETWELIENHPIYFDGSGSSSS